MSQKRTYEDKVEKKLECSGRVDNREWKKKITRRIIYLRGSVTIPYFLRIQNLEFRAKDINDEF